VTATEAGPTVSPSLTELRAQRNRRAVNSTWAAIAARVAALATSFLLIPLTIGYLGVEQYGILVALTALMSMFVFADLGLGNGLLNLVSDAHGRGDRDAASRAVSSAFFMLVAVALAAGAIALLIYSAIPWTSLVRVADPRLSGEIAATAAILIAVTLFSLPLGVIDRVRSAYQEGYISSVLGFVASLAGVLATLIAILLKLPLPWLVALISLPPVAALLANGFELFRRRRPWLAPHLRRADRRVAIKLAKIGFLFMILQLAVAVAYQSDVVVAGSVLGPKAAATYSVTLKFFFLAPSFLGMFLATLWPAYTEALARGDTRWVRQTLARSVAIAGLVSGGAALGLVLIGGWVIRTWTGGAIDPPVELLVGAALWSVVYATFTAIAMLLNAASVVLFQVVLASTMAIASIGLSILLANIIGLPGIVWGTLLAYVVFAAIPVLVFMPRFLRSLERKSAETAGTDG